MITLGIIGCILLLSLTAFFIFLVVDCFKVIDDCHKILDDIKEIQEENHKLRMERYKK